jgi:hypothetical protein
VSILPKIPLSLNELRPLVLESFKGVHETQYLNVCSNVAKLVVSKGIVPDIHKQNGVVVQGGRYELNGLDQDMSERLFGI